MPIIKETSKAVKEEMLLIPNDLGDVSSLRRASGLKNISNVSINHSPEVNANGINLNDLDAKSKGTINHDNSVFTDTLKSNRDERSYENNEEKSQSEAENNKILFDNILDYINKDSEEEDAKEERTNWRFSVFNLQRRIYYLYNSIDRDTFVDIPFEGDSEIFIVCLNFGERKLKSLLIDYLNVNPMIFYECMILSPVDKMFEFGDEVVFYNMIINKENFDEDPLIMRIIRKGLFLVLIINQKEENSKQLP